MSTPKKIAGTFTIPVLTLLILEVICLSHGENIITNQASLKNNYFLITSGEFWLNSELYNNKIFCLKKRTYATKGSLFIIIFSNIHLN